MKSVTDRYELEFFYRFCNKLKQLRNSGNFHLGPMADKIEPCDEEAEAGEGEQIDLLAPKSNFVKTSNLLTMIMSRMKR